MSGYWFRAKRYGWGWTPATWQGWLVMAAFLGLLTAGAHVLPPHRSMGLYLGFVGLITAGLVAVCRWKGEPARWRWGSDGDD